MPTYEYKREDGSVFEIIQNMSDEPLTVCPTTGQKVKRVITGGGGVVYKGDGWYVTDYKNGGKKNGHSEKPEAQAESSKEKAPVSSGSSD